MAKKGFIKDQNDVEILPITRGELVIDSSGEEAFHSNDFLATTSQPGLMSAEDKNKLDNLEGSIQYDIVSTNADGLAPKINTTASAITTQTDEWVLTTTKGATPSWRKLPVNAFLNRPISVNGTSILENNNTALNLVAGNNITLVPEKDTGKVTIHSNITDITGNAATATKLKIAVKLWGNDFDGSQSLSDTIIINNQHPYASKKTDGAVLGLMYLNGNNNLIIGQDVAKNTASTYIFGHEVRLCYGTTGTTVVTGVKLETNGNVAIPNGLTIGSSTSDNGSYKLNVNGTARIVGTSIFDDNIYVRKRINVLNSQNYPLTISRINDIKEITKIYQDDNGLVFDVTNNEKTSRVYWNFTATDTENSDGTDAKSGTLHFGINNSSKTYFAADEFQGNLNGKYINALTGYTKATTASDLVETDTLNIALGKLEYKADIAYSWYRSITQDDTDEIINKWDEVVDFVNGLEVDLTEEFVTRKTDQVITGVKTFQNGSSGEKIKLRDGNIISSLNVDVDWTRHLYFGNTSGDTSVSASFGVYGGGINNGPNRIIYAYIAHQDQNYSSATFKVYANRATILDNIILHTDNFNSYVPKLDGTGATGTWNIDINGSSTYLRSNSTKNLGLQNTLQICRGTHYGNEIDEWNTPYGRYTENNTPLDFGLVMRVRYSTNYYTDLWFDANAGAVTNTISYRQNINGGLTDWIHILTNKNFATYINDSYVKKSGDTMSGVLTSTVADGIAPFVVISKTLVNNLNAQYINGVPESMIMHYINYRDTDINDTVGNKIISYAGNVNPFDTTESHYGAILQWTNEQFTAPSTPNSKSTWYYQIIGKTQGDTNGLYFRRQTNGTGWSDIKEVAFTDSDIAGNAASATKLQTPRKIWGNDFDGTQDVYQDLMFNHSYKIQWRENTYADAFAIYPEFAGVGDYNKLIIASSVGDKGVEPTLTPKIAILGQSGNIGIGTVTPAQKLVVVGNTILNGNVGICTTDISYQLNVKGDTNLKGKVFVRNDASMAIYSEYNSRYTADCGNEVIAIQTAFDNQDPITSEYPNDYPTRCVLALQPRGGFIGIGTTSPTDKVEINGGAQSMTIKTTAVDALKLYRTRAEGGSFIVYYPDNQNTNYWRVGAGSGNTLAMIQYINHQENYRLYINNSGNVGIGTKNPGYRLHVEGNTFSDGFKKKNSSDSYVLLGGGGHKAISDFLLKSELANQELSNNLTTITKELTVTQDWMDTGIKYTDLPASGTYIVQVYVKANDGTGGMYNCYWSGIMSWNIGGTSDDESDEILLHRSGHAYYNTIYLRTIMSSSSDGRHLRLQIAANRNIGAAYTYTFKFKRII